MSLLQDNQKYSRGQTPTILAKINTDSSSNNVIEVLTQEERLLVCELEGIEEAKLREGNLRSRLKVVQDSLRAFYSLDSAQQPSEPEPAPKPAIRKASPRKAAKPTESSIAKTPEVSDTEVVKDEFSVFPE